MAEVGLALHPDKTRIVYCKDAERRGSSRAHVVHVPGVHVPAEAGQERGEVFVEFLPAVSKDALKEMSPEMRSWHIAPAQ